MDESPEQTDPNSQPAVSSINGSDTTGNFRPYDPEYSKRLFEQQARAQRERDEAWQAQLERQRRIDAETLEYNRRAIKGIYQYHNPQSDLETKTAVEAALTQSGVHPSWLRPEPRPADHPLNYLQSDQQRVVGNVVRFAEIDTELADLSGRVKTAIHNTQRTPEQLQYSGNSNIRALVAISDELEKYGINRGTHLVYSDFRQPPDAKGPSQTQKMAVDNALYASNLANLASATKAKIKKQMDEVATDRMWEEVAQHLITSLFGNTSTR